MAAPRPYADATALTDDRQAVATCAQRHGHCLVRGLVPVAKIEQLATRTLRQLHDLKWLSSPTSNQLQPDAQPAGAGFDDPLWIELQCRVLGEPSFTAVAEDPRLLDVLAKLIGAPATPHNGDILRIGWPQQRAPATPPHQEHHYIGGSLRTWIAWLPLQSCPLELGPLTVIDGSHRDGLLTHRDGHGPGAGVQPPTDAQWSSGDLEPGDVVFFHCLTVHGALPNMTADRLRISVDFRYRPSI